MAHEEAEKTSELAEEQAETAAERKAMATLDVVEDSQDVPAEAEGDEAEYAEAASRETEAQTQSQTAFVIVSETIEEDDLDDDGESDPVAAEGFEETQADDDDDAEPVGAHAARRATSQTPVSPFATISGATCPQPAYHEKAADTQGSSPREDPVRFDSSTFEAPAMQPVDTEDSCLVAAWRDIIETEGWPKHILTLMCLSCVPIANFFASGYGVAWGSDAARGNRGPLPVGAFGLKQFLYGLALGALTLIMSIANVWLTAVGLVPVLGGIVSFIVGLFAEAFLLLAAMRMAVRGSFGQAFELSGIFKVYRRHTLALLAASCVPGIAAAIVAFLIDLIIFVVLGGLFGSLAYPAASLAYGTFLSDNILGGIAAMAGSFSALGGAVVLLVLPFLFAQGLAQVWSLRAVGHWVRRYASDWTDGAHKEKKFGW